MAVRTDSKICSPVAQVHRRRSSKEKSPANQTTPVFPQNLQVSTTAVKVYSLPVLW
jgi:hypothetical protein